MSDADFLEYPAEIWSRLDAEAQGMVLMWRAVLTQAIRDLGSCDPSVAYEAAIWIGTEDYVAVCELALVKPDPLKKAIKDVMGLDSQLYRQKQTKDMADKLRRDAMRFADEISLYRQEAEAEEPT